MIHITYNMCSRDLPDMYALGLWAYISGKSLVSMLQLLLILSRLYWRLPIQKTQACVWLLQGC